MPQPFAYSVSTALARLSVAVPDAVAGPAHVKYLPPIDAGRSLAGHAKKRGFEGREWSWPWMKTVHFNQIMDLFNGAVSIDGYVRTPDWMGSGPTDVFADWACVLDAPIVGEYDIGGIRTNVVMRISRMSRIQSSP